jgi:hypothetical protein
MNRYIALYAAGFLLGTAYAALAHGDAAWIMADPKTSYCCGPADCERAPISAVKPINGGWYLPGTDQRFMEGEPDLHTSRDQDFWWCKPPNLGGRVKCLFAPSGGA